MKRNCRSPEEEGTFWSLEDQISSSACLRGDGWRRLGGGTLSGQGATFPPWGLIAKTLRQLVLRRVGGRQTTFHPLRRRSPRRVFPAEFGSINSVAGSNAAKTRQAKSGLIPVRCVSRPQSIEQKIRLPASSQAEETSESRAGWSAGPAITPH